MKVLFVSSHAQLGGSERYLFDLVCELGQAAGSVVALEDGPLVVRLKAVDVEVEVIDTGGGPISLIRSASALREVLKRQRPDVIHANGVKAALVCSLTRPGIPVVWVKHDFSWDGPLARLIARRCALVVGVSDAVLASVRASKTKVVMPGVPPVVADEAAGRSALTELVDEGGPVILLVGRVHPVKGHAELIAAAPGILAERPDVRFLFVGAPDPQQETYAREMRDLAATKAGAAVTWAGHRSDLLDLLAAASVAVIVTGSDDRAPRPEGFGYVAVEAMAVGTPVVAYAAGAIPEVLGDCGYLVTPGDRTGLVTAVLDALRNDARRDALIARGKDRAATVFSLDRFVTGMRRAYEEASS